MHVHPRKNAPAITRRKMPDRLSVRNASRTKVQGKRFGHRRYAGLVQERERTVMPHQRAVCTEKTVLSRLPASELQRAG
jgi:hypothetical protein